jgi:hypothetical protein
MFKQKLFFVGILKVNDEKSRIRIQDPDPLVRGMDPRIRIRIHSKMPWIRNTDFYNTIQCNISFFSAGLYNVHVLLHLGKQIILLLSRKWGDGLGIEPEPV